MGLKFFKIKWPVIQSGGEAETVIHQHHLACPVAVVHPADLGDGHMGLIYNDQAVLRKEVEKGERRISLLTEFQMP